MKICSNVMAFSEYMNFRFFFLPGFEKQCSQTPFASNMLEKGLPNFEKKRLLCSPSTSSWYIVLFCSTSHCCVVLTYCCGFQMMRTRVSKVVEIFSTIAEEFDLIHANPYSQIMPCHDMTLSSELIFHCNVFSVFRKSCLHFRKVILTANISESVPRPAPRKSTEKSPLILSCKLSRSQNHFQGSKLGFEQVSSGRVATFQLRHLHNTKPAIL